MRRGGTLLGSVEVVVGFFGVITRGDDHTIGVPIGDFAMMFLLVCDCRSAVTACFQWSGMTLGVCLA